MVAVSKIFHLMSHWLIGLSFSLIHILYISRLYENRTKFSHLSTLERELQLSPKEAFYYQFFKRIIESDSFETGVRGVVFDNLTEFHEGSNINSIRKFHIMPEIIMAFLFRNFMALSKSFNIPTVNCYYVEPDEDSKIDDPKVFISCEGLGEPIFFYLAVVWSLSAISIFLIYLYGYFLHRNIFAGCASIIYYFCVHEIATDISNTPMNRHNFALPFIIWQTFYLNLYIDRHQSGKNRRHQRNYGMIISLTLFTTLANLFWDMSTYFFLMQTLVIFILLQLQDKNGNRYLRIGLALDYAVSQLVASWICFALTYGNIKFMTSGSICVNWTLMIYVMRTKFIKMGDEDENLNQSRFRKFFYSFFYFLLMSWSMQDIVDRFIAQKYPNEIYHTNHFDLLLTMMYIKMPNFYAMLTYYRDNVDDLITAPTLRLYAVVFVFKNLSIYFAIRFYDFLHTRYAKTLEDVNEMQERAKNYVIEDFLESNRITFKDLSDPKTEKRIQECLKLLKDCNNDYEAYKLARQNLKPDVKVEKENFLNDIKKLKTQIHKAEKAYSSMRRDGESNGEENNSNIEDDTYETVEFRKKNSKENDVESETTEESSQTALAYVVQPFYCFAILQTIAISLISLKYLLTPFLCILSATLPSRSWFQKTSVVYWIFYMFLVLCTFNYPGLKNLKNQFSRKNEFRDPELENLIHWIEKTEPYAVFGANAEIAAHILLTTKRPIVNHPLIESPEMMERTKSLYSIYSKRSSTDIYNQLVKLRVQYVVISYESCFLGSKDGVRLVDIYDYFESEHYDKKPFCMSMFQKNNPTFLKVFENVKYIVIQIFSQSIQLELKKKSVLEFNM